MDAPHPHPDDLNDVERRLSGWQPAGDGLDTDAMLFAAGRASARRGAGRYAWPTVAGCLAVVAGVLGVWLAAERAERLALVQQLRQQTPPPPPPPTPEGATREFSPVDESGPAAYWTTRPLLDRGVDAWTEKALSRAGPSPETPGSASSVLRAWKGGDLLEP
jgi:hypothetical protein